jgi:hypothetical protein
MAQSVTWPATDEGRPGFYSLQSQRYLCYLPLIAHDPTHGVHGTEIVYQKRSEKEAEDSHPASAIVSVFLHSPIRPSFMELFSKHLKLGLNY